MFGRVWRVDEKKTNYQKQGARKDAEKVRNPSIQRDGRRRRGGGRKAAQACLKRETTYPSSSSSSSFYFCFLLVLGSRICASYAIRYGVHQHRTPSKRSPPTPRCAPLGFLDVSGNPLAWEVRRGGEDSTQDSLGSPRTSPSPRQHAEPGVYTHQKSKGVVDRIGKGEKRIPCVYDVQPFGPRTSPMQRPAFPSQDWIDSSRMESRADRQTDRQTDRVHTDPGIMDHPRVSPQEPRNASPPPPPVDIRPARPAIVNAVVVGGGDRNLRVHDSPTPCKRRKRKGVPYHHRSSLLQDEPTPVWFQVA